MLMAEQRGTILVSLLMAGGAQRLKESERRKPSPLTGVAMCSPTPGGLEFLDDCTDEEILLFLEGRRDGDAVPLNVITEVNPYSTKPWDLPEDIWYLFNAEDTQSYRGNFILTDIGYWRPVNDLKVVTSTSSVGRKTTRDFFLGKEPFGYRTGWVMHDYRGEEKPHPSMKRDYTSLCKVFFQNEQQTNTGEQDTPVTAGVDVDNTIDSKLLRSLEQEEPNALENHAIRFQVSVGDGHSRSSSFEKNSQDLASYRPVEDTATNNFSEEGYLELKKACNMEASSSSPVNSAAYDFSKGDYLELNDLYSSDTSSSSSDNSSYTSGNLDEYFDSDALLRDIGYGSDPNVDKEHVNCKFSVSASVKPDNVVINLPPRGFVHCNNSDVVVEESLPVDPLPEEGQDLMPDVSVSAAKIVHTGNASPSGTPEEIRTNQSPFSQDLSSPRGGSRSSGRMAKLRKKYLCFGSF